MDGTGIAEYPKQFSLNPLHTKPCRQNLVWGFATAPDGFSF